MSRKSIRFYNDHEVRAVWDDEQDKWWFSAVNIVGAVNDETDYTKCRNYWKYLKGKMAKKSIQLVSALTTSSSRLWMESPSHYEIT